MMIVMMMMLLFCRGGRRGRRRQLELCKAKVLCSSEGEKQLVATAWFVWVVFDGQSAILR